ncbi:MAG: DUF1674 domain-containing protein [Gammaproteobacteria bacterium]
MIDEAPRPSAPDAPTHASSPAARKPQPAMPREIGGRDGPDPTRYGDWEKAGRCIDF